VFDGHVKALTSVRFVILPRRCNVWTHGGSWSKNARYVLASSKDWNITVWDLASDHDPPLPLTTIRFDASVRSAALHPRNRHEHAS
jgi:hypothetical protein